MAAASVAREGRRQRIGLVASHAPSLLLFRADLIRAMLQKGHDVLCLAPDFEGPAQAELERIGATIGHYPLERTGLNALADFGSVRALSEIFGRWQPDVVCGYTPKPAIYATLAAHQAKVPRIVPMITGLGYAFTGAGTIKSRLVRRVSLTLYARALARCHGVIFHNSDDRAVLRDAGVLPASLASFVVGGSGVDLDRFHALPFPEAEAGLVFLMIARLLKNKGVLEFCEAAQALRNQGAKARFVLAGPPETGPSGFPVERLKAFAGAVDYVGPQSQVHALIAGCHVYVLPSHGEGLPRTVLEAMAVGRPIITTTARGCRDTVEPGVNGVTVPVGNVSALAEAMKGMLARPDLLPAMAAASRRIVSERFDVRLVTQHMLTAFGLSDNQRMAPE
jgi:glycosyltransferase involved in cell wall biosynthesis